MLDLGIDLEVWPWIWVGVASLFAIIEFTVLAGSFVLLPFAVSAALAALAGFYDASVELQWGIFVVVGALLWYLFWRYAKRFINNNAMPPGVGADRLIGMTAIVTRPIDPDDTDRRGRVRVVGEDWGALSEHDEKIAEGAKVRIVRMDGTRVVVDPIPADPGAGSAPTGPPLSPPSRPEDT